MFSDDGPRAVWGLETATDNLGLRWTMEQGHVQGNLGNIAFECWRVAGKK